MSTLENLIQLRAPLAEPAAWTKGTLARDAQDEETHPHYAKATCWCLYGAIDKVTKPTKGYGELCELIELEIGQEIDIFNDAPDTTHDMVLALIDSLIAQERARDSITTLQATPTSLKFKSFSKGP